MSITILSATYANRRHILKKTLPLWESLSSVGRIIIIDNGSSYSVRDFVKSLGAKKTEVYHFTENKGSAGAYKRAMEVAVSYPDTEYCIILDDDNVISNETLERLISHHTSLQSRFPEAPVACLSVRMNMSVMLEAIKHQKEVSIPTRHSSAFCGIDIFIMVRSIFQKKDKDIYTHHEIPLLWGTYGGTFFHRTLIQQIGVPREELFLYADDPEWSIRITSQGGYIVLFTDCHIDDIDDSWWVHRDDEGKLIQKRANPLFQGSDFRVFYGIRGLVWLERNMFIMNHLHYIINQNIVIVGLGILAIITGKWRRYRVILHAIDHGKKGIFDNSLYREE